MWGCGVVFVWYREVVVVCRGGGGVCVCVCVECDGGGGGRCVCVYPQQVELELVWQELLVKTHQSHQ
jgi:hypothetical protein